VTLQIEVARSISGRPLLTGLPEASRRAADLAGAVPGREAATMARLIGARCMRQIRTSALPAPLHKNAIGLPAPGTVTSGQLLE
jgi:hypothetical protein